LRPGRVLWTFAHIWLGITAALALSIYVWRSNGAWSKIFIPLFVFYLGTRLNAIAVQIHEAAHHLLFSRRRLNDLFCNLFGAYWILNDTETYRRVHLVHHSDLHLETDPDRELYELPREGGRYVVTRLILQDLFWVTAFRRIFSYLAVEAAARRATGRWLHAAGKVFSQAALCGVACALLGWEGVLFYGIFWLVPLFSIFPAIVRLRIVTEHFSPLSHGREKPFVSRTTCTHPLEIYLFGCDMEFHLEHHLLPAIPHPQLARLHAALMERDFFESLPSPEDHLSGGYVRFWVRLLSGSLRQSAPRPALQAVSAARTIPF
jgi:fatty acid desaturase